MNITAEDQFFLDLISGGYSQVTGNETALERMDWESVLQKSLATGMAPLLYKNLPPPVRLFLSDDILRILQGQYRQSATRNTVLEHELYGIGVALERAQVGAIILKGMHLAKLLYPDIAARPMGDIDLLIRLKDLDTIRLALGELGFGRGEINSPRDEERFHLSLRREREAHDILIEMHWMLVSERCGFNIEHEAVWSDASKFREFANRLYVMSPEHTLLYLCMHIAKHGVFKLKNCLDIALLIMKYSDVLDWDSIHRLSVKWRIRGCVSVILATVGRLFHPELPSRVLDQISNPDIVRGSNLAVEQVLSPGTYARVTSTTVTAVLFSRGLIGSALVIKRVVLPTPAALRTKFSTKNSESSLLPMYFRHLKEILKRYLPMFIRLITLNRSGWIKLRNRKHIVQFLQPDK